MLTVSGWCGLVVQPYQKLVAKKGSVVRKTALEKYSLVNVAVCQGVTRNYASKMAFWLLQRDALTVSVSAKR